ncbi:MAG: DUF2933 domain-containing protein [Candidatus Tectomicrobia bacterium]|uniref:DUF2933 domain-containing protein n=1 Tax=Tectimicrobiota bacterium TaxID=2528274 RepID=A0A932I1J2_UNCTE|nr:DUF2933 domain-containing protein [Candidatus Tectomicrobia bacterium]
MDWLWFLAFAGLMIVMHRFGMGCCGGHAHGGGKGHDAHCGAPKPDGEDKKPAAQAVPEEKA